MGQALPPANRAKPLLSSRSPGGRGAARGIGDAGQAIDEPERVGKPRGRLLLEVAVQGGKQLDAPGDGVYAFGESIEAFIGGHVALPSPISIISERTPRYTE